MFARTFSTSSISGAQIKKTCFPVPSNPELLAVSVAL